MQNEVIPGRLILQNLHNRRPRLQLNGNTCGLTHCEC
jgi:hypothetical protein